MYNYIKGTLEAKYDNFAIVENNGIGYEFNISYNTYCELPSLNEEIKMYAYYQSKDDGVSLFGFLSQEEKDMFLLLITVNGVGPKMALQILSNIKLVDLGIAISSGDLKMLSQVKGCGKKTAERIIVELKDKIDSFGLTMLERVAQASMPINEDLIKEASEVLTSLGCTKNEAVNLCKSVYKDGDTVEDIVSKALKNMGR